MYVSCVIRSIQPGAQTYDVYFCFTKLTTFVCAGHKNMGQHRFLISQMLIVPNKKDAFSRFDCVR